ncbi:hypothetical protein FBU59_002395 [Linderina macrospora]|uniref:Uncharacterized protein n=1 Tax=Linderina macrospora TaxID=4868 RepID=A0ACC1JBA3_9FUNG|nr:hypothetical protein FBU59_002395 [Linderina macrospora]
MAVIPSLLQRIGRGSLDNESRSQWNLAKRSSSLDVELLTRSTGDLPYAGHNGLVRRSSKLRRARLLPSSPKFFAKVTWVDTLSRLAMFVPLGQINIPQPVYE